MNLKNDSAEKNSRRNGKNFKSTRIEEVKLRKSADVGNFFFENFSEKIERVHLEKIFENKQRKNAFATALAKLLGEKNVKNMPRRYWTPWSSKRRR